MTGLRMNRVQLLEEAARPMYRVVRHEAVPRVPVGGSAVTAERLDHVSETARARKALVQVVPFSGGAHPRTGEMMRLKEFEGAPPTVCTADRLHKGGAVRKSAGRSGSSEENPSG